jgi:hypothetical protein
MAVAMAWASRITTVSLEMAIPPVVGYWIDQRLGTRVVFTMLGAALGMTAAIWQLTHLSSKRPDPE